MTDEQTPEKLLVSIAKILDQQKIAYFVSGGFAVSVYGRPRFTADIDVVINISEPKIKSLVEAISNISENAYIDEQQIKTALAINGEFNYIDPNTGMKIDFFVVGLSQYASECFQNIRKIDVGYKVNFISPEDLIIAKLKWFKKSESTRQLEDVASVLENSKINQKYLEKWIPKFNLDKEFLKAKGQSGK